MTTTPNLFAPFAGVLVDQNDHCITQLVARFDGIAITAAGQLVKIERASEWLDRFPSWHLLAPARMSSDQMRATILLVESLLSLKRGTLSAESLEPALKAAAALVNASLLGLQQRLNLAVDIPTGHR